MGEFESRVEKFIQVNIESDDCSHWVDILRLEFGREDKFCGDGFTNAATKMLRREDGVDFNHGAISYLFNNHWQNPVLPGYLKELILSSVLQLPWWLNETGDLNDMQYWSENHQIGWKAGKYLIGQAFAENPELQNLIFEASNTNGEQSRQIGKEAVRQWLDYRSRFGFSEFNSDTYAPIAFKAMVSVAGLSKDPEVKRLAEKVMNLQMFDHIIGSKEQRLATARGRAYSEGRIGIKGYEFMYLIKGIGKPPISQAQSAMLVLALKYGYQMPMALLEIAQEVEHGEFEMKERFGLYPKDGEFEGIHHDNPEDCIFWFSNGAYFDPVTPECIFITGDAYDLWDRTEIWGQVKLAKPIWDISPGLVTTVGEATATLGGGSTLGSANVYTYRTPDFMLSSAQNYHPGWVIGQQQPWQATLDPNRNGSFFSHQPTTPIPDEDHKSDYWVMGIHPKAAQYKSTLISLHNPDVLATLIFSLDRTHANFRRSEMDELYTSGNWVIGSQGNGYVAMYSNKLANFESDYDLVALGIQNVWICEVGSKEMHGSFENFTTFILNSSIEVSYTYDDSFVECMIDNQCLNGVATFFECLLNTCQPINYNSATSKCVMSHQNQQMKEDNKQKNFLDHITACFDNVRSSDIEISYARRTDGATFTFGWSQPLKLNGIVVQREDQDFPRYENAFAKVPWGAKVFNISSQHYSLIIDFEED